jgi:dynein assembly factor 1
VWRA